MQWFDTRTAYGWTSIFLHWIVAIIITVLWGIGDWMQGIPEDAPNPLVDIHISIAASTWLLIWIRIGWRMKTVHPLLNGQTRFAHYSAKLLHYVLLAAIAVMLISGPTMVWTAGYPIEVFGWFAIPSPTGEITWVNEVAHQLHGSCADVIVIAFLIHVGGAFKHLMFNNDETFIRMLVAPKRNKSGSE